MSGSICNFTDGVLVLQRDTRCVVDRVRVDVHVPGEIEVAFSGEREHARLVVDADHAAARHGVGHLPFEGEHGGFDDLEGGELESAVFDDLGQADDGFMPRGDLEHAGISCA